MQLITVTQPTEEPVSYQEAKDYLRLGLDQEQTLIESYITSAREFCEKYQNKTYLTTVYKYVTDDVAFPIVLPNPPIQSVEKIEFQKRDGTITEWDNTNYVVDTSGRFGVIRPAESYELPENLASVNTLQITYTAGNTSTAEVSERVKNAIKLLVSHWYENRVPVSMNTMTYNIQFTVNALLDQDRVMPV